MTEIERGADNQAPREPEDAGESVPAEKLEEMTWEDEGGPILEPGISLTLRGPEGADLEAALKAARDALPEGYRLERD